MTDEVIHIESDADSVIYETISKNFDDVILVQESTQTSTNDDKQYTEDASPQFLTWNKDCPVCFDKVNRPTISQPCYHMFCLSCLVPWLQTTNKCPLCRQPIKYIYFNFQSMDTYLSRPVLPIKNPSSEITLLVQSSNVSINSHLLPLSQDSSYLKFIGIETRRRVYRGNLRRSSNPRLVTIDDPDMGAIFKWIERDILALFPSESDSSLLAGQIYSSLVYQPTGYSIPGFSYHSQKFKNTCRKIFGLYSTVFIDELINFLHSSMTIQNYDMMVRYI